MCNNQFTELRKEIEVDAYKYNSIIDELILVNSNFKCLRIGDTGFGSPGVKQEFEQVQERIEKFISYLTEEHKKMQGEIKDLVEKNKQVKSDISVATIAYEQLSVTEMELDLNLKRQTKLFNLDQDKMMANVEESRTKVDEIKMKTLDTLSSLQKLVEKEQNELEELQNFKENFKSQAVTFFSNMRKTTNSNLEAYMQEMRKITEAISALDKRLIESKEKSLQALKQVKQKPFDQS